MSLDLRLKYLFGLTGTLSHMQGGFKHGGRVHLGNMVGLPRIENKIIMKTTRRTDIGK